jgi:hypothetical protein
MYVNPVKGNDANTGSRLSSERTITGALKATQSSAIIQLAPGTYSTASGGWWVMKLTRVI